LLSGASIVKQGILQNIRSVDEQRQPCGVDLTFRRALRWTSAAAIDFDNSHRRAAETSELLVHHETKVVGLLPGAYLVEFNEKIYVPLDCMAQIFSRSSLWRSGAVLSAGVIDPGYRGALGALLQVTNPAGINFYEDAKLGQIVLHRLEQKVEGYRGIYQSSTSSIGRDGTIILEETM
jgi:dUTP pyrophosphatase